MTVPSLTANKCRLLTTPSTVAIYLQSHNSYWNAEDVPVSNHSQQVISSPFSPKIRSNFSHDSIYSAGKLSLTVCSLNKGQIAWKLTPSINLTMDVQFVGQSLLEKKGISYYQSIEFWKKKNNSENPNSIYSRIIMLSSHHHWSR